MLCVIGTGHHAIHFIPALSLPPALHLRHPSNHSVCLVIFVLYFLLLSLSSPSYLLFGFPHLLFLFICFSPSVSFDHAWFSLQVQQKVAYLEEQVRLATVEKDHVLSELLLTQEDAEQSKTAVHNLQAVLEQFQKGL